MRMKREQLINLYSIIRELKSTNLKLEAKKAYALLRIELVKIFKDFEVAKAEIAEQTKNDDEKKWNEDFSSIMNEWLNKEVELDCKIFSVEDHIDFISSNDLVGIVEDVLADLLIKN